METDFKAIPTATPTFSTMPDLDMALPTRSDIGGHLERKMSATKLELILCSNCGFPMSADVGQCRQCRIRVAHGKKNKGVAVGIASKYVSVQKLFPLPVSTSGFMAVI